jgi:hypothetical protein
MKATCLLAVGYLFFTLITTAITSIIFFLFVMPFLFPMALMWDVTHFCYKAFNTGNILRVNDDE